MKAFGLQLFGGITVICLIGILVEPPIRRWLARVRARRARRRMHEILRGRSLARRTNFYIDA